MASKRIKIRLVLFALSGVLLAGQWSSLNSEVHAANPDDFRAGNIISDLVFTNSNAMSADQIQQFLEAKNSACLKNFKTLSLHDADNNGYGDEPYGKGQGYKVLASKLIWQAAQIYNINPKVILVTLQKEQGLITRDDCPQWRYNTALGYGCPDSAPCNDTAYGFTRQIDYGVWHFRGFFDDSLQYVPYAPGEQRIYYHPDLNRCGSSIVNIQNRATASLYSYTPYQPNQASLDAGYGTGNSCSSYGNRNFWLYFTDWFGSTRGGPFFKTTSSAKVYLLGANGTYYHVRTPQQMEAYGYGSEFTRTAVVGDSYLSNLVYKGRLPYIARFEDNAIYAVAKGKLHHFASQEVFEKVYGRSFGEEAVLPASMRLYLDKGSDVSQVLRQHGEPAIYLMEQGKKRHISSWDAFTSQGIPPYAEQPSVRLSSEYVKTLANGAPILAEGTLVKTSDTEIYGVWHNGALQPTTQNAALATGLRPYTAHSSLIDQLPWHATRAFNKLVQGSDGKHYIIDRGRKLFIPDNKLADTGLTENDFTSTSDKLLAKLTTATASPLLFRIEGGDKVYVLRGGELQHIYSAEDFDGLGYSMGQVINIAKETAVLFKDSGLVLFKQGRLIRIGDQPAIYLVDSSFVKRHIPSMQMLIQYGFDIDNTVSVTDTIAEQYATGDALTHIQKGADGTVWLMDSGQKRKFPETLLQADRYSIDKASISKLSDENLARLRTGKSMTELIRDKSTGRVFLIENGERRWYTSPEAFENHQSASGWGRILNVSPSYTKSLPTGEPIQ